jgi:hypothetical protein
MSAITLPSASRVKVLRPTYTARGRGDRRYVRLTEQTLGARELNGERRVVRRVVVTGLDLVLDGGDSSGLLKTANGADDVAELYIAGDTVTINTQLRFPGTAVYVYARSLTFASEAASIDTGPTPRRTPREPGKVEGRDGLPAGSITVVADAFHPASRAVKHFRAVGGSGEPGDDRGFVPGTGTRKDVRPVTADDWKRLMSPSNRNLRHEDILGRPLYYSVIHEIGFDEIQAHVQRSARTHGGTLTYAEITNSWYTDPGHRGTSRPTVVAHVGSKDLPGRGPDAAPPGRAGTGGPGGTFTGLPAAGESFMGDGGTSASEHASPGGRGGTPRRPVWAILEARPSGTQQVLTIRLLAKDPPTEGAWSSQGPPPRSPTGPKGAVTRLDGTAAHTWVNGVLVATVLQYAHDAVAANDWDAGQRALEPYLDILAPVGEDARRSLSSETLEALAAATPAALGDREALTVAARQALAIASAAQDSLDEYGNPVGWAPSVSLDTALDVYSAVLDGAISQLRLAYTLEHAWSTVSQRGKHLDAMIVSLTEASDQARQDLVDARSALVSATSGTSPLRELSALLDQSRAAGDRLTKRLKELSAKADEQQQSEDVKHAIAAGLEIGGALVKAIPLPEPVQTVTGGIGTLAQITSSFVDEGGSDAAFDALDTRVKAFVGRDDLAESFTTDLDAATGRNDERSAELAKRASAVGAKVDALQATRDAATAAKEGRASAIAAAMEAFKQATERASTKRDTEKARALADAARASAEAATQQAAEQQQLEAHKKKLEGQQTELETANAALAKAKSERVETVKKAAKKVQQVATGVAEIGKAVNDLMVHEATLDSRWAETLAKIAAKDDELAAIKRDIDYLNRRKLDVAQVVKAHDRRMTRAAETIERNAVALVELRAQYARTRDALDPQALGYIQAAQRDAQQTLARFLYYVVKAYEYYTVKPWATSQYAMINDLVNRLGTLLARAQDPDATSIDAHDLSTLKAVYEAPLTSMAGEVAETLMTGGAGRPEVTNDSLRVKGRVLAQLNDSLASDGSTASAVVKPAALGWLDIGKEKHRIRDLTVKAVSARKVPNFDLPDRVIFTFMHTGQSIVRAEGRLYAFVASDSRPGSPLQASVTWETRAAAVPMWTPREDAATDLYDLASDSLTRPEQGGEGTLLSRLMKDAPTSPELAKLSRFRPGGFSELLLLVEVFPSRARLELAEMIVSFTQEAVVDTGRAMVSVLSNVEEPVPIQLSRPDLSGSNFGTCELFAIFARGDLRANPVELWAPPQFAGRPFQRWVVDDSTAAAASQPSSVRVNQSCEALAEYGPAT